MTQQAYNADEAFQQFRQRMHHLQIELGEIKSELGRPDFLGLADRTRDLLRMTRGLLDGNVNILFANEPARVPENLYKHIEYAQGHLDKALGEEYEFDAIVKRLYMATTLSEYVIRSVQEALNTMDRQ